MDTSINKKRYTALRNRIYISLFLLFLIITVQKASAQTGPDLIVDEPTLKSTLKIVQENQGDQCLINEGCLNTLGLRKLLKFTTKIANIGNKDFILGAPGGPGWNFDGCHGHWHYEGYADYRIFNTAGVKLTAGHKMGFQVIDNGVQDSRCVRKFNAGNQGISVGCADVYSSGLPCQWIDITTVPDGIYTVTVTTNPTTTTTDPSNLLFETNYQNNSACATIVIEGTNHKLVNNTLVLPTRTIANTQKVVEGAFTKINNSGAYILASGATVQFQAGAEIQLLPGFEARAGSAFSAVAKPIFRCSSPAGIPEGLIATAEKEMEPAGNGLQVYPNPASDFIEVSIQEPLPGDGDKAAQAINSAVAQEREYVLLDLYGQKFYAIKSNAQLVRIPTTHCKAGLYVISVRKGGEVLQAKVMIRK